MVVHPHSWPTAIAHVDGNAFFASVMQATYPYLQGKPVTIGKERGIVTAVSYEAQAYGVTRGMRGFEVKRRCPRCVFLEGDYDLFSLFSNRMFTILRRFSPIVEEYSVDEGFIDLFGMRGVLHMTYVQIARSIQEAIQNELGIPVSVGISLTKSLAKLASGSKKPRGITLVSGTDIEDFLKTIQIERVWGIGPATASFLKKNDIHTAHTFAFTPTKYITHCLSKPYKDIQQELCGVIQNQINTEKKTTYQSIGKTHTFSPPSNNKLYIWAQLRNNIEQAFSKARKYGYCVVEMNIFLKTQQFKYVNRTVTFDTSQKYPLTEIKHIQRVFQNMYTCQMYRATGCWLTKLSHSDMEQISLFVTEKVAPKETALLYEAIQKKNVQFGTSLWLGKEPKHTHKKMPRLTLPSLILDHGV